MNREPYRIGGSFLDPMFDVPRNEQVISGVQSDGAFIGELQNGLPLYQKNPLILGLIIPKVLRTALAMRNNPFHSDVVRLHQGKKVLLRR
jgi:hypothetical protein